MNPASRVTIQYEGRQHIGQPGRGGALPYKRLLGMCRWMGSHFHDWTDYHGVTFSIELVEWGGTFSEFWGKTVLHIYS